MFEMTKPQPIAPGVFSLVGDVAMASRLSWLDKTDPGPALITELDNLSGGDLPPAGLVHVLRGWERAEAWLAARKQTAIVAVAGAQPRDADDWAREEVAACLRLSPGSARNRVRVARQLCGRLAATHAALLRGQVTVWQAITLTDAVAPLPDGAARAVQTRVLPRAHLQTLPQFRASVRRAVIAVDPRTAQERHLDAAAGRCVDVVAGEDGTATVYMTVPAADAAVIDLACHTLAREMRTPGDTRTLPQRTADALTELCRRYLTGTGTGVGAGTGRGAPRTAHGRPFTVDITIDLATLAGLADHPAHLAGYGPITPDVARDIARTSLWRWVLTDPTTGAALDCTTAHDPGQHLTDIVIARHPTCTAAGCHKPAVNCDLDHTVPYPAGPTCECNLAPLCRRHHRMKHEAGWTLQHLPDHTLRWTTPAGAVYYVTPPAIGPPHPDPDYEPPALTRRCAHPKTPSGRTARSAPVIIKDDEPPF
ncbi:MAG: hypothetical protein QOG52_2000 [Frankiaceae bacterium]|jgi:hypothetical protein|nr:hypothetical protein [Frankiaceae bacterium]